MTDRTPRTPEELLQISRSIAEMPFVQCHTSDGTTYVFTDDMREFPVLSISDLQRQLLILRLRWIANRLSEQGRAERDDR